MALIIHRSVTTVKNACLILISSILCCQNISSPSGHGHRTSEDGMLEVKPLGSVSCAAGESVYQICFFPPEHSTDAQSDWDPHSLAKSTYLC